MIKTIKNLLKLNKKRKFCSAIIAAAGSSSRMGGENKLFSDIEGIPVIVRTLLAFENNAGIDEIIVVTRESDLARTAQLCADYGLKKVSKVVLGGETRQESVLKGIYEASKNTDLAAIHDGARPLVTDEIILAAIEAAAETGAAAPYRPLKDTIKEADNGKVLSTLDRSRLAAVQTPQVFDIDILKGALYKTVKEDTPVTDDCSAVEAMGFPVTLTPGSDENIKITTPTDLIFARAIISQRGKMQ